MVHENDYVARYAPREREKEVYGCSDWRARDRVRGERRATRRSRLLSPSRCMRVNWPATCENPSATVLCRGVWPTVLLNGKPKLTGRLSNQHVLLPIRVAPRDRARRAPKKLARKMVARATGRTCPSYPRAELEVARAQRQHRCGRLATERRAPGIPLAMWPVLEPHPERPRCHLPAECRRSKIAV